MRLGLDAFLARECDEAIDFFVGKLGFGLVEGRELGGTRWVVGTAKLPRGSAWHAVGEPVAAIGRQAGRRVFLETADFDRDRAMTIERGARFVEAASMNATAAWRCFTATAGT